MKTHLKPVPGFVGLFAGSDGTLWRYRNFQGHSKGKRWNGWRQLVVRANDDGYLEVSVPRGEKWNRHACVHIMVALAFHGQRPARLLVTHLDGDKLNNRPGNLAYRSTKDNSEDSRKHGTMVIGDRHHKSKITDAQAREILRRNAAGETRTSLAREFGIAVSTIDAIKAGRVRAHLQQPLH